MQTKKRNSPSFYFLYDFVFNTNTKVDKNYTYQINLKGHQRISENANVASNTISGLLDDSLNTCAGLKKNVHSIGIYLISHDVQKITVQFNTKTGAYLEQFSVQCNTEGKETYFYLSKMNWNEYSEKLESIVFISTKPHTFANATIVFYTYVQYDIPPLSVDKPINFDSDDYRTMIQKSIIQTGNNHRLKKAINKAKRGEEVTISYIGGSVTQGSGAVPIHNCYAYQSYLQFKRTYGQQDGQHIHFVKAGVDGTPSELGMIRYQRDILKNGTSHPDILIIDFAVNDADDETNGVCFESLLLKALQAPHMTAVILVFGMLHDNWNLQERFIPIGLHYDLPMISIKNALLSIFNDHNPSPLLTRRQFFKNKFHPNNNGHRIIADCITTLIDAVSIQPDSSSSVELPLKPLYGDDYINIKLIDRINIPSDTTISRGSFDEIDEDLQNVTLDFHEHHTPQFPYNWYHTGKQPARSFIINIKCKKLLLVHKNSGDSQFGQADIIVNGNQIMQLNSTDITWNRCNTVILINEQQSKYFTVEIKMSEGQTHKQFTILGFGYVE